MTDALFEVDDFEETRTDWVPIYKIFGDLASMIRDDLCRDCGAKSGYNQGGAGGPIHGSYMICDDCAGLDSCQLVCCEPVAERRPNREGGEESAHCACGWWLGSQYWADEGGWVDYTPEQVADSIAAHAEPRHVSHWGISHHPDQHDRLIAAQQKRRAAYLRKARAA